MFAHVREVFIGEMVGVRLMSTTDSRSMLGFNDLGKVTSVDNLHDRKGIQWKLWIRRDSSSNYPLIDEVASFDIFGEDNKRSQIRRKQGVKISLENSNEHLFFIHHVNEHSSQCA